jgi:two-component system sensor histidine kinase/response regulator
MLPEAVEDAATALAQLRAAAAAGQPYDLAMLDLLTPDMDGLELARLMAADPGLKHVRKILLTSSAPVDSAELAALGNVDWCAKPVRASVLYDQLLRLMAVDRQFEPRPSPVADAASIVPPRRGRILVAEDNAINQLVAEQVLAKLGYSVDIVGNGAEALAAIKSGLYSAVLMDCHMPVMDGFEAARQIRITEAGAERRLPIIAMTAGVMEEDRERCTAAGMDGYIAKPISIKAIDEALAHWTSRSATGAEAHAPGRAEVTAEDRSIGAHE